MIIPRFHRNSRPGDPVRTGIRPISRYDDWANEELRRRREAQAGREREMAS